MHRASCLPRLFLLLLAICCAVPSAAEPDPAEVDAWAERLGSLDFATRKRATDDLLSRLDPDRIEGLEEEALAAALVEQQRLREIVFLLLRRDDPEVSSRAREILDATGWATPEQEVAIAELLRVLREAEEDLDRTAAYEELLALGRVATESIEEAFRAPDSIEASLSVEPGRDRCLRGESLEVTVALRNEGETGFWIREGEGAFRVEPRIVPFAPLPGRAGPDEGGQEVIFHLLVALVPGGSPVHGVRYLAPGERFLFRGTVEARWTGELRVRARYVFMPRLAFGGNPSAERPATPVPLPQFPEASPIEALSEPVLVFPPTVAGVSGGLELETRLPLPAVRSGERLHGTVLLRNRWPRARRIPDPAEGEARAGLWYVIRDVARNPVRWGPLGEEITEEGPQAHPLPSGGERETGFDLPTEGLPEGAYTLQIGLTDIRGMRPDGRGGSRIRIEGGEWIGPTEDLRESTDWRGEVRSGLHEFRIRSGE